MACAEFTVVVDSSNHSGTSETPMDRNRRRPPASIHLRLCVALRGPPSSPRASAEASLQSAGSTGRRPPPARSPPPHAAREEKTSVARTHELTHRRLPSGWDGTAVLGGMRCGSRNPHPEFKTPRRAAATWQPEAAAHGPAANPEQPQHSCAGHVGRRLFRRRGRQASGSATLLGWWVRGAELQRSEPDTLANLGR